MLLLCLVGAGTLAVAYGSSLAAGAERRLAPQGFLVLTGFVWFLLAFARLDDSSARTLDLKSFLPISLLALIKIWLVSVCDLVALGPAGHDDALFVRLAGHLRACHWLGDYNQLTLAKGPFYPLWIAVGRILGVPLLLGQHLLYIAACVALVVALRTLLRRPALLLLYAALLFNPMTVTGETLRVMRESVYTPATLLVFACLIGLHTRRTASRRVQMSWAISLGLSLSAFWLTREEGLWMVPSVALLLGFTAMTRDTGRRISLSRLALCALPLAIWGGALGGVCGLNYLRYGVFTTCECRGGSFVAAYGALTRVKPARWQRYVPVAEETRRRIYAVSPTFRELEPYLEGPLGKGWAKHGALLVPRRAEGPEIAGGWFLWALRDAVAWAGHCQSGRQAATYYRRLAREVNAACDAGLLAAHPARATMMPPWHDDYAPFLVSALGRSWTMLTGFGGFSMHNRPSWGSEKQLQPFHKLTSERFAPLGNEPVRPLAGLELAKHRTIACLGAAYQNAMPFAVCLALAVLLAAGARVILFHHLEYVDVLMAAALIALVARAILIALVDVTSFPAFGGLYLLPAYPVLLLFTGLGLHRTCQAWSRCMTALKAARLRRRPILAKRSEPGYRRAA